MLPQDGKAGILGISGASSGSQWLVVRLYTLEERRPLNEDSRVDDIAHEDRRLRVRGWGGKGFAGSGGGVRLTKLWNGGMTFSIPSKDARDEDEDPPLSIGGRLRVPAGCGLGIIQGVVS